MPGPQTPSSYSAEVDRINERCTDCSVSLSTSGYSGTYLEKSGHRDLTATTGQRHSIWFRNVQLACFISPSCDFHSVSARLGARTDRRPFSRVQHRSDIIIALQAIGGLVTAAVMQHASNILKCFAISESICNCAIATNVFFDSNLDQDTTNCWYCYLHMLGHVHVQRVQIDPNSYSIWVMTLSCTPTCVTVILKSGM